MLIIKNVYIERKGGGERRGREKGREGGIEERDLRETEKSSYPQVFGLSKYDRIVIYHNKK